MYYLADFAFENISDRALGRIRERSNLQNANKEQLGYKKNLDFRPKVSKGKMKNLVIESGEDSVYDLGKQLKALSQDPSSKLNNQVIKTRKIGTKLEKTGMSAFPNSQPKGFKRFFRGAKVGALNLAPYVAAPVTIGAGIGVVNKLRGKTWTGKDK